MKRGGKKRLENFRNTNSNEDELGVVQYMKQNNPTRSLTVKYESRSHVCARSRIRFLSRPWPQVTVRGDSHGNDHGIASRRAVLRKKYFYAQEGCGMCLRTLVLYERPLSKTSAL